MSEIELQELARHMGHELAILSVTRGYYRTGQNIKIAVENGKAHKFSGLCLDDINITDFDDVIEPELCIADKDDVGGDNVTHLPSEDENMDSSISSPGHQAEKPISHIPKQKSNKLKIAGTTVRTKWTDEEKHLIRAIERGR